MNTAILIVDMLNEYLLPEGKVYCEACRNIIPNIKNVINYGRNKGIHIVYVNTSLEEDDILVKKWGIHAISGTKMSEVISEISPHEGDLVVNKKGYNGFFQTTLNSDLNSLGVERVVVAGIHTHVCVLLTAVAAFEYGYDVITLKDCITTGYQPNHDTRLRFFASHTGRIMKTNEWIELQELN